MAGGDRVLSSALIVLMPFEAGEWQSDFCLWSTCGNYVRDGVASINGKSLHAGAREAIDVASQVRRSHIGDGVVGGDKTDVVVLAFVNLEEKDALLNMLDQGAQS